MHVVGVVQPHLLQILDKCLLMTAGFSSPQKRQPIVQALPIDIVRAQKRQIERLLLVNEFALGYFGLDPIR